MTQHELIQSDARLASETEMGAVTLKVADLDNMIRYYTNALPLNVIDQQGSSAIIGRGSRPLVILEHSPELKQASPRAAGRSEEHTSELQSRFDLVCRLLLEKKKLYPYKIFCQLFMIHVEFRESY